MSARPPLPPVEPLPREPGQLGRWWSDARHAVRSDLALHGLAYLGVLLLFAGVTGLIVFSFGDVEPWVRSVAEFLLPSALFLSAWYLGRRGAVVVAASLTLLGGAITPIVVAASMTDGAPFPPDPLGRALPIAQGVAVATVALAMALVVRRAPSSPLRFLVGPTIWMAAGLAAGVTRDPIPAGYDTARPDSLQLAVVLVALTVTVLWSSWGRAPDELAGPIRAVALPVAGVVYVLELVLAGDEGWPIASTIVTGLTVVVLIELMADSFRAFETSTLQFLVVVVGAAQLATRAQPEWVAVGAGITLLALVEYDGWRRPGRPAEMLGLATAGCAFLLTLSDPAATAVAFGVVTLWGTWRHVEPADWLPISDGVGVVPALGAVVTTAALWDLSARGPALVATSAVILLIAIAGRLWDPIADDMLWRWSVPSAAVALSAVSIAFPWGDAPTEVAAATAMSAAALVSSVLPAAAKAWLVAATVVWSLANIAEAFGFGRDAQAVALAAMALALLLGSLVAARPICVHLATIGHVVGLAALVVPTWPGWAATAVVAGATAGFWATTFVDERGEAVHTAALRSAAATEVGARGAAPHDASDLFSEDELAPLLSMVGLWATVLLAADAANWIAIADPWAAALSAGIAVVTAVVVRITPWRRARRRVLEWIPLLASAGAAAVAIAAAGSNRDDWSPVVTVAVALVIVLVTTPPRPAAFIWTGWVEVGAISVLLADRLGLDRTWADLALASWGAAALIGGLVVRRVRHGPAPTGTFVRDRVLLPPIVIGAGAFMLGGILGLSDGSDTEIGWTAAGLSLVVLATAMLLPLGALVALAEALATAAYVLLAPWEPLERPWTFAPWALLLLGVGLATRQPGTPSLGRWDLPSFVVAHGVAGLALVAAAESATVAVTSALFGGISIAVAVVLRRWPWAAAGGVLLLIGGFDAGQGWLALVLLGEGLALTVIGLLRTTAVRWSLLGLGALSVVGAWFALAAWQSWPISTVFFSTVPAAAATALAAAVALRHGRVPRELAAVWAIAGAAVTTGVAVTGLDEVARRPGGLLCAGSLLVLAVAAAVTAPLLGAGVRWLAAALAVVAWAPAAWAVEMSASAIALIGTGMAMAATGVALAARGYRPSSPWISPGVFVALATQFGAAWAALAAFPDHEPAIVVLLAVAAELVALGVISGRREFYVISPLAALGAWVLYAADALTGDANWFTVPIGMTVLVMVGLVRWIRRGRSGDPTAYDVIAVELVGMSFLVGLALARTLAGHLWNGLLAIGFGVLLTSWGGITRVRWRATFGAITIVLATVLLIGVPLSQSVTWRGPALWITMSLIGIVAIMAAAALERSRDQVRQIARRLDQMTAGWERIPRRTDRNDQTTTQAFTDEKTQEVVDQ